MSRIDAYYTPKALAEKMATVCASTPRIVADFASGDGGLLTAAAHQWPKARLVATDISHSALNALRRKFDDVAAIRVNFLSNQSRVRSRSLEALKGRIGLVLLNPPFSCRGSRRISVSTETFDVTCSPAMAFVLIAFEYLQSNGEMVAILPAGSLISEKDGIAWRNLRSHAEVRVVSNHDRGTFQECFPTTRIVHIKRTRHGKKPNETMGESAKVFTTTTDESVVLVRGCIPMYDIPKGRIPLAHSTDLKDYKLIPNGHKTHAGVPELMGAFVAITRVGSPKRDKVALHYSRSEMAISDCVIALRCASRARAAQLHSRILDNWSKLVPLYGGTGAKYITVSKLRAFLEQLGYRVHIPGTANWQLKRAIERSYCPEP